MCVIGGVLLTSFTAYRHKFTPLLFAFVVHSGIKCLHRCATVGYVHAKLCSLVTKNIMFISSKNRDLFRRAQTHSLKRLKPSVCEGMYCICCVLHVHKKDVESVLIDMLLYEEMV